MKETKLLFNAEEDSSEDGPLYSLVVPDLTQIRPSYDEIKTKGGGVTPGVFQSYTQVFLLLFC